MQKKSHHPQEIKTSGPYSPAITMEDLIFISGQGTYDPDTGQKYLGDISRQTKIALENLKRVLETVGISFKDLIKVNLFLTEEKYIPDVDKVYKNYFGSDILPSRSTIIVSALPGGMGIEIEAIAYMPNV
jgi:2-iminobutanoate/2-iminopropanoate deaminase